MEICTNPNQIIGMVPCFHQSNVYIKRKLQVWRTQKCIAAVDGKTALTCTGLQTTRFHGGQFSAENGNCGNSGLPIGMVPRFHQRNVYMKRKLWVWRVQNCIPPLVEKSHLAVRVCKLPGFMGVSIVPRMEICGNSVLLIPMVPRFQQSNVYIKRKLRVWRDQKCIPLVGAKTVLTSMGPETNPFHAGQHSSDRQ